MISDDTRRKFITAVMTDAGGPLDSEWVTAFEETPRDIFVPQFFTQDRSTLRWNVVDSADPGWEQSVWTNRSLVTQLDGDDSRAELARADPLSRGSATSSSSTPSLMALMLQALNIEDGHKVLEIGTGSGYNAALLCHRLGDSQIFTVDVDAGVVQRASDRLHQLGYHPHVVAGDGLEGLVECSPYDRLIATVGVPLMPTRWIDQIRQDGQILFPVDLRNCGGLLPLLTVRGDTAEGHFLPAYGGFMPVRSAGIGRDAASEAFRVTADDEGATRTTLLPADIVGPTGHPAEFFIALLTGGIDWMSFTPDSDQPTQIWLADGTGSWACHVTDSDHAHGVRQGGNRKLWDLVEKAYNQWLDLGSPPRQRFGLTVTHDGQHRVWIAEPDSERRSHIVRLDTA